MRKLTTTKKNKICTHAMAVCVTTKKTGSIPPTHMRTCSHDRTTNQDV